MRDAQKPIVWVTGAGGLIGNYLVQTAQELVPEWQVIGLARKDLDLTDTAVVRRLFQLHSPHLIIHCAALSKSPACQADPSLARLLNVEVTKGLAELSEDRPFIFFSTDLIFDGLQGNYSESAAPNPLSIYAETKVEAERSVTSNPKHTVVRTSLNGGTSPAGDRGFNEELRRAWKEGKSFNLFTDEFRCPIPAVETARITWKLARTGATGIFHLAGRERLSRYEIGQLVANRWPDLNPKINPGSLRDYKGAPRSPDTSLNCAKLEHLLKIKMPGLSAWLASHPDESF